jgi:hypothetical protein
VSKPFRCDAVRAGDLLVLTRDESRRLRFKFMGHDGSVVATWVEPPPGRPLDVIVRQRDVRIAEPQSRVLTVGDQISFSTGESFRCVQTCEVSDLADCIRQVAAGRLRRCRRLRDEE